MPDEYEKWAREKREECNGDEIRAQEVAREEKAALELAKEYAEDCE